MERNQIFVKFLDGRTRCLQMPSATVSGEVLKEFLLARTGIPLGFQRLVSGLREIGNETLISASEDGIFPSCSLLLRLRGGKGGFGSLLRGAATKAGQKKTNNFDACRDMSGRRLRHVNAEKRLEEWKAEAEGRKLEKLAEQFLKSKTKQVKKTSSKAAEKYIEKYKEDSAKCMEEVEESVRQSFELYQKSKRKALPSSGSASKRLRTWFGDKKGNESESDDEDEDKDDVDLDKSNGLDGDVMVSSVHSEQEISDGGSGKSDSVNESEISLDQKEMAASKGSFSENLSSGASLEPEKTLLGVDDSQKYHLRGSATEYHAELIGDHTVEQKQIDAEVGNDSSPEEVSISPEKALDACVAATEDSSEQKEVAPEKNSENEKPEEQLNFEKFNSAGELEVLGMEGLKSELQARGLKCGGTLKERAARLFLLKSTPLDKLPKKLLAKPLI